jgi:hypothetical protein
MPVIGGGSQFSFMDIGGCNCPACALTPCPAPKPPHDFTLTVSDGSVVTLSPTAPGNCEWQAAASTPWYGLIGQFVGPPGCWFYWFRDDHGGSPGGSNLYYDPPGCEGAFPGGYNAMVLSSHTCSPFTLVFTFGGYTMTLTY